MDPRADLIAALETHQARVYNYFRRMGATREAARDLAQETFVRAIRSARRYRGDAPVAVWLLGIARNVFREAQRKVAEDRRLEEALPEPRAVDGPATEPVDVERVLATLDRDHREVLVLRFVLDLPGEEVARLLGITHDAVRQRVARAKAEFRRLWEA